MVRSQMFFKWFNICLGEREQVQAVFTPSRANIVLVRHGRIDSDLLEKIPNRMSRIAWIR